MELQYLSGTQMGDDLSQAEDTDFYGMEDGDELGKRKKGKGKLKKFFKKALHVVNRVNPATVLLRNGVLASMKLNLMKVASRLKYAYLSDAEAQKRGIDMGKFKKLRQVKDKLEKIFFGAGGKPANLRKAILTGKGNKSREVSGLEGLTEATPLPQLLGEEMFRSENAEVLPFGEDLGGALGEPVTAAAIAAASGAVAAIAGLLKAIGNIFPKKDTSESQEFENEQQQSDSTNLPAEIEKNKTEISTMDVDSGSDGPADESSQKTTSESSSADAPDKQGFWDKNKNWIKPTLIGVTGLGLFYLGYNAMTANKPRPKALSGTKSKIGHEKKDPVALM